MPSTFFGLEIGRRGLTTHQKALEVTSHNLANASTPGYSRQTVQIATTDPFSVPTFNKMKIAEQLGTGVDVLAVMRIRDQLLDGQIQNETANVGYWEAKRDMLDQLELIMNEPTDSGIRQNIDDFWAAMEEFSKRPDQVSLRSALCEKAITMVDNIRHDFAELQNLRKDVNTRIVSQVEELNKTAARIANINEQIGKIVAMGDNPNDLLDTRDDLIEKLGKMVDIQTTYDETQKVYITIRGRALVMGDQANKIITENDSNNDGMVKLEWDYLEPGKNEVELNNGSLKGLLKVRDEDIVTMINSLQEFTATLIAEVNAVHKTGYGLDNDTGNNFFSGTDAQDIDVEAIIQADLNKIAASGAKDSPGNNEIALKMCELKHKRILAGGTANMGDYIAGIVGELGVRSSTAIDRFETHDKLTKQLISRRDSISGVSIDEEMTNLVKYQQGYNAAAKVISTMNELLDVVINGLKTS